MTDNANQCTQMQNLIFSLYHRLEIKRKQINELEQRTRYLNNYCNFLINTNNNERHQYSILSQNYNHLYKLYMDKCKV